MSLNKITLSGNLGREAEVRYTKDMCPVTTFPLGVSERVRDTSGNWVDHTNWIDCVMFGKRGEALAPCLQKGAKVAINGRVRTSTYEAEGRKVKRFEVHIDDIDLMQVKRS